MMKKDNFKQQLLLWRQFPFEMNLFKLLVNFEQISHLFSSFFIVDFEQVNVT